MVTGEDGVLIAVQDGAQIDIQGGVLVDVQDGAQVDIQDGVLVGVQDEAQDVAQDDAQGTCSKGWGSVAVVLEELLEAVRYRRVPAVSEGPSVAGTGPECSSPPQGSLPPCPSYSPST